MKIPPNTPKTGNGLVEFIITGNSIRLKWVKKTGEIRIEAVNIFKCPVASAALNSKAVVLLLLIHCLLLL